MGNFAGTGPTGGSDNIAIGEQAGSLNSVGGDNIFIGREAGGYVLNHTDGDGASHRKSGTQKLENNIFIGSRAGSRQETVSFLPSNTVVGHGAAMRQTTGIRNTFFGTGSGGNNTTGHSNTFIGHASGYRNTTGSNNIFIGYEAAKDAAYETENSKFVLGNSGSKTWLEGDIGGDNLKVNNKLVCLQDGTNCSGGPASSKAYKKNIRPFRDFEKSLADILKTPLFSYQYRENHPESHTGKKRMGLIAEELPKNLRLKSGGSPPAPDWPAVYGTLWAGIKALAARLGGLRKDLISLLNSRLEGIKKELSPLKKSLEKNMKFQAEKNSDQDRQIARQSRLIEGQSKIIQKQQRQIESQNRALTKQLRRIESLEAKLGAPRKNHKTKPAD